LFTVYKRNREVHFSIAANPQFLREGTAVEDFLHPERVLLGVEDPMSESTLREIYAPLLMSNFRCLVHPLGCPPREPPELLITSIRSAEMIKHAANAFLAVKISYANVLADICERLGANIQEVTRAIGLDPRIRPSFLNAGILQAAEEVNRRQIDFFFEKVQRSLWVLKNKRIGLLGLAHKAGTDDIRGSPAIELLNRFQAAGAQVHAYDPRAMASVHSVYPDMICEEDAYNVAECADALVVATDWKEFLELDWRRIRNVMARPTLFDGRNLLSPPQMKALGFEYYSVGRPDS